MKRLIQVAGVMDSKEAEILVRLGVTWLGFPLRLDVNMPDLTEREAGDIIRSLPQGVHGVVITYESSFAGLKELVDSTACHCLQLHGHAGAGLVKELKAWRPDLLIIKSLVVGAMPEKGLFEKIDELHSYVDAFITDSHDPSTGAHGATGLVHDWDVSCRLSVYSPKPVILAGGLTPDNVADAIMKVKPSGVDVHTGLEDEEGRKCPKKTEKFISEAKRAFDLLEG